MKFDHEKLDVYRVSIEFVAWSFNLCNGLSANHRHARDQLLRSSQSVPQNIAEGNGKRSLPDRCRFLEFARGSAVESAATLDILKVCGALSLEQAEEGKEMLIRVVAMLSRMTERKPEIREEQAEYGEGEIEHEHEHEHEHENEDENNHTNHGSTP